jgi:2,3-bisphosphoglycerate-dependent phosphoglycerate mutase
MQPELFPRFPEPFTIYLVRHATPDRSRYDIPYHTPPGPELTERGRREAAELAVFLQESGVVNVLASPLVRAWRTGIIISERCGARLEVNLDLAEWRTDEHEKAVLERMQRAFETGIKLAQEGPVAMVSHGSPILTLLKSLGLSSEMIERCRIYDSRNLIPMAGVWRIENADNQFQIQLVFTPTGIRFPAGLFAPSEASKLSS